MDQECDQGDAVGQHRQQVDAEEQPVQCRSPHAASPGPPSSSAPSRFQEVPDRGYLQQPAHRQRGLPRRRGRAASCPSGSSKSRVRPDGCSGFPMSRRRTEHWQLREAQQARVNTGLYTSKASDIFTVYDFRPKGNGENLTSLKIPPSSPEANKESQCSWKTTVCPSSSVTASHPSPGQQDREFDVYPSCTHFFLTQGISSHLSIQVII